MSPGELDADWHVVKLPYDPNLEITSITTVGIHQMWDALLRVECSLEGVSSSWRLNLEKDLKKRISRVS